MGMQNNIMQGMGMGNMNATNDMLGGMSQEQMQQFQQMQQRKALAQAELAKQQAARMQQQQNQMQGAPSTPGGMTT